jgi:Sec-independent protein translocase protein TatA
MKGLGKGMKEFKDATKEVKEGEKEDWKIKFWQLFVRLKRCKKHF